MASDLIRPHIDVHALVTACCRGFIDVIDGLLKCGVDINASARVLLCSSKPALHANTNCTPLVAAVVSRQVAVVRLLLQVITAMRIFAMSNPTLNVECTAVDAFKYAGENIVFGSGEPFENVDLGNSKSLDNVRYMFRRRIARHAHFSSYFYEQLINNI